MIDRFRRLAQRAEAFRLPSIIFGLICLTSIVVVLIGPDSPDEDRLLLPSVVGLLWAMSLYSFIDSFRSVPEKTIATPGLLISLKHRLLRGWYWVKGLIFLASTTLAVVITSRMVSIWLTEYAG